MILYADDLVLFARNPRILKGMVEIIAETYDRFSLKLAEEKTVMMAWNCPDFQKEWAVELDAGDTQIRLKTYQASSISATQ